MWAGHLPVHMDFYSTENRLIVDKIQLALQIASPVYNKPNTPNPVQITIYQEGSLVSELSNISGTIRWKSDAPCLCRP
jgi:hypothetical protein